MSNNNVLGTALSIIDKHIHLNHKEIARKIYAETNYCDQDYNKFIAVITSGNLTLREYIRKRRLFFAASELVNNPDRVIADVSLEYGYSDQTAFARAIKREFGKTPVEIRKSKDSLPDVRKVLENHLANKSRLDSIIAKLERDNLSNTDWHYFEDFIHATDELGFDISTCCLISELSEKLSIPFGYLLQKCFEMAVECDQEFRNAPDEVDKFMMDLGIESGDELDALCLHYNCKWYELTLVQVKMYQLGIDSKDELDRIWKFYDCKWMPGVPYPVTREMVQDYRSKHRK